MMFFLLCPFFDVDASRPSLKQKIEKKNSPEFQFHDGPRVPVAHERVLRGPLCGHRRFLKVRKGDERKKSFFRLSDLEPERRRRQRRRRRQVLGRRDLDRFATDAFLFLVCVVSHWQMMLSVRLMRSSNKERGNRGRAELGRRN